jgi:hypothetical protein
MAIVCGMNPIDATADPLFDIELKVARRADELSRDKSATTKDAFELWCEAERQVLAGPQFKAEANTPAGSMTRA